MFVRIVKVLFFGTPRILVFKIEVLDGKRRRVVALELARFLVTTMATLLQQSTPRLDSSRAYRRGPDTPQTQNHEQRTTNLGSIRQVVRARDADKDFCRQNHNFSVGARFEHQRTARFERQCRSTFDQISNCCTSEVSSPTSRQPSFRCVTQDVGDVRSSCQ